MNAYIVSAVRTAGGRRNGRLSGRHPVELAAEVLNAAVDAAGVPAHAVDDVILGASRNMASSRVRSRALPYSRPICLSPSRQ